MSANKIQQGRTFLKRWNRGNVRIMIPRSHAGVLLHIWKPEIDKKYLRIDADPIRTCFNGYQWANCNIEISASDDQFVLIDPSR